jgi:hypothetical protein
MSKDTPFFNFFKKYTKNQYFGIHDHDKESVIEDYVEKLYRPDPAIQFAVILNIYTIKFKIK